MEPDEIRLRLRKLARDIEKGTKAREERDALFIVGFEAGMATEDIAAAARLKPSTVRVARLRKNDATVRP